MGRKPVLTRIPDRVRSGFGVEPDIPADTGDTRVFDPGEIEEEDENGAGDIDYDEPSPGEIAETDLPRTPDDYEVVFDVLGQEIGTSPGDTIGTEIRRAMVEGGRAEEDAVYVHRKHARIERLNGSVFLRRLGDNTLEVNGELVGKNDVVPIGDGDEVTFSDVVTAIVHIEEAEEKAGTDVIGDEGVDDEFGVPDVEPKRPTSARNAPKNDPAVPAGTGVHQSLDVLINTIPGEILVLWAAIEGAGELYEFSLWTYGLLLVIAILATPVYVYRSIDDPEAESDGVPDPDVQWWQESNVRWQTVSATGAFLVWAYYLGGPFQVAGIQNASLAVALVIIYPVLIVISPYYGSLILFQLSNLFDRASA